MADPHELREPRLAGIRRHVPDSAKALPKWVQSRRLTRLARRRRRAVSPADSVLIVGTARSGSTWLFEMLASDPAFLPVFEPYHPRNNPKLRAFTDPIGQFAPPADTATADRVTRLVAEICAGRELTVWSARRMPRSRLRSAPRTLVKDVSTNRALWWLSQTVPVPTVLLIRHPCAVVESMLRTGWAWRDWTRDAVEAALSITVRDLFGDELPVGWLADERPRLLAAWWAISTRAALAALQDTDRSWVVAFEDLVADTDAEIRAFTDDLGFDNLQFDASRPSFMTARSSSLLSGDTPVDNWRKRLSYHETEAILDTAHSLGVPFYTEAIYPDHSLIDAVANACHSTSARPPPSAQPGDSAAIE